MADTPTITTAEVAALLGIARSTFIAHATELRRDHGFPLPVPCSGGRRHSRAAVLAWIDGARPATPPINSPLAQDVADGEAVLLNRARAMMAAE